MNFKLDIDLERAKVRIEGLGIDRFTNTSITEHVPTSIQS